MKRLISILILCIICISLCACQPTPDEHFVVSKGDGKLMEIINGAPAPSLTEPYSAPETWTETLEGTSWYATYDYTLFDFKMLDFKLTIEVDANITVPDVLEYPVYEAVFSDYDQETFENFLYNTVGDVDLYTTHEYMTKLPDGRDYGYKYVNTYEAQRVIEAIDYQLNDPTSPFNKYYLPACEGTPEGEESRELLLEKQTIYDHILNHQSDFMTKVDKQYSSTIDNQIEDSDETFLGQETYWFTSDGNSRISIERTVNQTYRIGYEPNCISQYDYTTLNPRATNKNLRGTTIDIDSAREQADEWCKRLGLDDWTLVNVGSTEVNTIEEVIMWEALFYGWTTEAWDEYEFYQKYNSYETRPQIYLFTYTPTQAGVPVLFSSNVYLDSVVNLDVWVMPHLQVAVGDSGVLDVQMVNGCSYLGECLNTNVELLPFEKIQQIFRNYIIMDATSSEGVTYDPLKGDYYHSSSDRQDPDYVSTRIHIDDIRLGYIKVKKINTDEYIAIPAWCFYGQEYNKFTEEARDNLLLDENNEAWCRTKAGHVFLCINAIDGSIINLMKGY